MSPRGDTIFIPTMTMKGGGNLPTHSQSAVTNANEGRSEYGKNEALVSSSISDTN